MEKTLYEIVCWPETQMLETLDGFYENSYLIDDEKGLSEYGSAAYFVNKEWLDEHSDEY